MTGTLWLAWRQQRPLILTAALLVTTLTVWVALGRAELIGAISGYDLSQCKGWNGECPPETYEAMTESNGGIRLLGAIGLALPAAIGMFWGAPLIGRELESGTIKVVLTQDSGVRSWFAARFGLAALCAVTVSTAVAALIAWWWAPISNMYDGVYWHDPYVLNASGPSAVAGALFALAAGTAIGLLVRRTLPAMGATLAVVLAVAAVLTFFRRDFVTPVDRITPECSPSGSSAAPGPRDTATSPPTGPSTRWRTACSRASSCARAWTSTASSAGCTRCTPAPTSGPSRGSTPRSTCSSPWPSSR